MTRACLLLGLVGLCAVGCGDDEGSGGAGGAGTTTTTGNTTTGGTTKASTSVSSSAQSTTASSGSTTSGSTNSSTGTGMMLDCTPDPQGDACFECAKESCCDEAQVCAMDPECGACLQCIQTMGDILACLGTCNLQDERTAAAGQCIMTNCSDDCGL